MIVPPGDSVALAHAFLLMLDQPMLARTLADRARDWAMNTFDPELEAQALATLYKEVVRSESVRT